MTDYSERFVWFLPILIVGLYALAPGALNIWLLYFSWSNGLEIERNDAIFAVNGVVMSVIPALFVFIPRFRRGLFRHGRNAAIEAALRVGRFFLGAWVVLRAAAKFKPIPLPEPFDIMFRAETVLIVLSAYAASTVFPAFYGSRIAQEEAQPLRNPKRSLILSLPILALGFAALMSCLLFVMRFVRELSHPTYETSYAILGFAPFFLGLVAAGRCLDPLWRRRFFARKPSNASNVLFGFRRFGLGLAVLALVAGGTALTSYGLFLIWVRVFAFLAGPLFALYVFLTIKPGPLADTLADVAPIKRPKVAEAAPVYSPELANNPLARSALRRNASNGASVKARSAVVVRSAGGGRGVSSLRKAGLAISYVAILIWGAGVYAIWPPQFVPSRELFEMSEIYGLAVAVPFCIVAFVGFYIVGRTADEAGRKRSSRLKATLFSSLLALTVGYAGVNAVFLTAPALHSFTSSAREPAELVVVVKERGDADNLNGCGYQAKTELTLLHFSYEICGVPPDVHEALRPGDRLSLTGYQTSFGIRYDRVERVETPDEAASSSDGSADSGARSFL